MTPQASLGPCNLSFDHLKPLDICRIGPCAADEAYAQNCHEERGQPDISKNRARTTKTISPKMAKPKTLLRMSGFAVPLFRD